MAKKNILLTGRPRVGKSTLIRRIAEKLQQMGYNTGGFYTLETSIEGKRTGFSISTLDGKTGRLAEIGLKSRFTLGKYGIDMEQFESLAIPAIEDAIQKGHIAIIDEIGFMELKSSRFRELVEKALSSPQPVIATIMRNSYEFPDKIKARKDVLLFKVTVENRERLADEIVEIIIPR